MVVVLPDLPKFFASPDGMNYIGAIVLDGKKHVVINLDEVKAWDSTTANAIIDSAVDGGIKAIEGAFVTMVLHQSKNSIDPKTLEGIGFSGNCIPFVKIHEINPTHIGKLIRVRGLVNRLYDLKATGQEIVFKCRECSFETQPIIQESPFSITYPPRKCRSCNERVRYDVVDYLSKFISSQRFHVQELHEDMSGHMPRRLPMVTYKKWLINKVHCGDMVDVIGVVRTLPIVYRGQQQRDFAFYLEVYHLDEKSKDPENIEISKDDEALIHELAANPDIYSILINDIAPSLGKMEKCKEACLLSLFGGVPKVREDITIRGTIHVLIVGDPSTGKSKLLTSVANLAPRGMYSQGKGVSGVGLTAALNKDHITGEWVIDAGVLVLADKGVACIDEIDKMRDEDRDNIHTAMADEIVPINKAGINTTLPARTAVIAAANPSHRNKYDSNVSVFENLKKFPSSLFNRFDLIFVLVDEADAERDRELLEHVHKRNRGEIKTVISRELFTKYIAYAKRINPEITEEARDVLGKYWLKAREHMGEERIREETHPIKLRQYDALERLCEARARALLKTKVDKEDALCILKLFGEFLEDISFELDAKEGGVRKTTENAYQEVYNIIKEMQGEILNTEGVLKKDIIAEAVKRGIPVSKAQSVFAMMINEGSITEYSPDRYKTIR